MDNALFLKVELTAISYSELNFPDYIAFPDLMTYSYIKKIDPQNKLGTKKTAK